MLAGIVKEGVISCPRHGWHYDLAGGASTDHPGYTLKTYQIEVVGDDIMIKLG
jgi:nitrite reductase/ring-hydroxylating ferredoxin subunit